MCRFRPSNFWQGWGRRSTENGRIGDCAGPRLRKSLFEKIGIPTPQFKAVKTEQDLYAAMEVIGVPAVMKICRRAMTAKGRPSSKLPTMCCRHGTGSGGTSLLIETFIPFQRELSMICVRSTTGETAFYPLNENVHRQDSAHHAVACHRVEAIQKQAEDYATKLLNHFQYAGVMTIEFCEVTVN